MESGIKWDPRTASLIRWAIPGRVESMEAVTPEKAVGVADNQFDFLHRWKLIHCSEYKTKFDCGVGGKFNALPLIFCPGKLSLCSGSRKEILLNYEVPPWSKQTSIDSCAPMVSCHRALVSADGKCLWRHSANVLFIMADDLNADMDCYPGGKAQTPHLDRLAARGCALIAPTANFRFVGPVAIPCSAVFIPTPLGSCGTRKYSGRPFLHTTACRKPFVSRAMSLPGLGSCIITMCPNQSAPMGMTIQPPGKLRRTQRVVIVWRKNLLFSVSSQASLAVLSWYASPQPDEKHTDGMLAEDAIWLLERFAKRPDRPFFWALGFYRPHTPYVAPKCYFGAYPTESIRLVEGVQEDIQDLPAMALGSHKAEHDLLTDPLRREAIQAYRASVSFMDAQVGRVLQALERLGLSEETIVVFTSDHGYHLGEHGLWQKMSLFEESARVPLIMAGPGVECSWGGRACTRRFGRLVSDPDCFVWRSGAS